jgi:hypothetical protein
MHCITCNAELSDFESTRRDVRNGAFLDMCNECINAANITTLDRFDLADENDLDGLDCHLNVE